MKTWQTMMALAVMAAVAGGCIQDQKTLKLKKDGSGTLVEEIFMSPQLTGMMEQMTAGMEQAVEKAGAQLPTADKAKAKAALDPLVMFKSDIEKRTSELGPGVKLISAQAKTSDKGWKGYVLTYSFSDITKVNLSLSDKPEPEGGMNAEKKKDEPLIVTFRKGPQPEIKFQQKPSAPAAAPAKKTAAEAPPPGAEALPAAMLGPMLQGMRISFVVEVDGKITQTSSHYRQGDNRVVLLDLQMEKVLANTAGAKLLEGGKDDPALLKKIHALKIPGLAIEDLEGGVSIQWK